MVNQNSEENVMKSKGLFILCAVISLVLCACGGLETGSYEPPYEEENSSGTVPDSTDAGSAEGTAGSDTVDGNICLDCGYERLEVACGLCSGTGNSSSCSRCGGTGIICRNCFYPPSQPQESGNSTGETAEESSGKAGRMCGGCHGDGLEGECFSCGGTGILGHTEYYGSGWDGDTYYTTRPCLSCVGGERRCTLCGGDGFVDDE